MAWMYDLLNDQPKEDWERFKDVEGRFEEVVEDRSVEDCYINEMDGRSN